MRLNLPPQADELLLHIFDRFRQGDSSSSKSTQGLGLGLSIVQTIVELHGGSVGAESGGEESCHPIAISGCIERFSPRRDDKIVERYIIS
jgi:signal transduction histidine kinase